MTRSEAVGAAVKALDEGRFAHDLAALVAHRTESQNPARADEMTRYLTDEMQPRLERMGFACSLLVHEDARAPFLFAERIERPEGPTVFLYGHGDVTHGEEGRWRDGLDPWSLELRNDCFFGRGAADNKGQHLVNLHALAAVIGTRGQLGFNMKVLIEMGEEIGSPGLRGLCSREAERLKADLLIASDGPRITRHDPTIFLGSRSAVNIDLSLELREGGQHSGNWGGVLADPAIILLHAIASITGPTGQIRIPDWVPGPIPAAVREALKVCTVPQDDDDPVLDPAWGEPGLTPAERLFGWSSFTVLSMLAGRPEAPMNAVPPFARARCQLRFVVGVDPAKVLPALRAHLDRHGFGMVRVTTPRKEIYPATRLSPDDPWVVWAARSMEATTGRPPVLLPNLGGSLPNDIFTDTLGMRTIWVPHSYSGCSQHAPNEHLPVAIVREGLAIMAGLFWDLGEDGIPTAVAPLGR
jgi:acetylornithine deacetylase/succinyl-diaminopimelate desuccinylase-like protein